MPDNNLVLKPISTRISKFVFRNQNDDEDLFLCAEKIDNNNYSSKKISYVNLANSYINFLKIMVNKKNFFLNKNDSYFNPKGEWNFFGEKGIYFINNDIQLSDFLSTSTNPNFPGYTSYEINEVLDEDENTAFDRLKYLAVNHKFAKSQLLNELDSLSVQLYGKYENDSSDFSSWKQILPSYVGMVILNDNLSSEKMVQKIYGENTTWRQIEGRYLLGCGSISQSNTINTFGKCSAGSFKSNIGDKGGQYEIASDEIDLAKHSHKFKIGPKSYGEIPNFGKLPRYFVPKKSVRRGTEDRHTVYYPDPIDGCNPGLNIHAGRSESDTGVMSNKTVNINLQTYGSKSGKPEGKFKAELEIEDFVNTENKYNQTHSNMHPYYATYIWERIS